MTETAVHPPTAAATAAPAPNAATRKLVFITGCGRSGTTILGRLLEQREDVCYLNDRFDLWIRPFPFSDIWGRHMGSAAAGARVALGPADAANLGAARDWFFGLLEKERGDRPILIEKLAINNFRIGFLLALCPDAHIINITRNGIEVAASIEQKAIKGHWYGVSDRKWSLLVEHAWANGYGPLVAQCRTPYERGLLEWRMSVEAAEKSLPAADPSRLLRLRYEDLLADPLNVCEKLDAFLGVAASPAMRAFAAGEIRRQSPAASERQIPASAEAIAGPALRRLGYWPS